MDLMATDRTNRRAIFWLVTVLQPGPADPKKVPYYLLLVGSPSDIPYGSKSQLDVQYAVGRIHFDSLDEYASYAQSVVASESESVNCPGRQPFLGWPIRGYSYSDERR